MQTIIEIPQFLPPTKTSDNSAAGDSIPRTPAAVFIPAPGMARNAREQNSEPLDIPPFLRRARPAHDAIEPERRQTNNCN